MSCETVIPLIFTLKGIPQSVIDAEFDRLASHPRLNASPLKAIHEPMSDPPQRYLPQTADKLRLGFVSELREMGAWGRSAPVLFKRINPQQQQHPDPATRITNQTTDNNDSKEDVVSFAATVMVPALSLHLGVLPFRLVIVDAPLLLAVGDGITPGASIVAVENAHSHPDSAPLAMQQATLTTEVDWTSRPFRFTRAAEQFQFLSQLSSTSPPELDAPPAAPSFPSETVPTTRQAGPLLSLTLYANDPRMRYDREVWMRTLSVQGRDALLYMQREAEARGEKGALPSTLVCVEDVYPVQCDGSCWCEGHLPTPAPIERRIQAAKLQKSEERKKRRKCMEEAVRSDGAQQENPKDQPTQQNFRHDAVPSTISFASDASGSSSAAGRVRYKTFDADGITAENADDILYTATQRRGWCVSPLHSMNPIAPFYTTGQQTTMQVWHTTVNVAPLECRGLQIEAVMPIPIYTHPTTVAASVSGSENETGHNNNCSMQTAHSSSFSDITRSAETIPSPLANGAPYESPSAQSAFSRQEVMSSLGGEVSGLRWISGIAVLQPPMFKHHTSGTLAVPLCFVDTTPVSAGRPPITYWQTVYVQYLFVFPFEDKRFHANTLEVVRSLASWERLSTKKLVGHRGLGKTYTRKEGNDLNETDTFTISKNNETPAKEAGEEKKTKGRSRFTVKLAENSLEALNAAHRRGCEMVEFDVMLTRDRIPVLFHDPVIQLQAREKKWLDGPSGGAFETDGVPVIRSPSFTSEIFSLSNHMDNVSAARAQRMLSLGFSPTDTSSTFRALKLYMQHMPNFASIPVAMHQLTKRQLDTITTETFSFSKSENKLRDMILRHWNKILRVYRNRERQKYLESINIQLPDGDGEFRGCLPCNEETSTWKPQDASTMTKSDGDDLNTQKERPFCEVEQAIVKEGCKTTCPRALARERNANYYKKIFRNPHGLRAKDEDVTNRICTLRDLFEQTPPTLRFDLEVKFPFQPLSDSNLFHQIDAFEINAFVDTILQVVFSYVDQRQHVEDATGNKKEQPRDVIFSSFEPDVCMALQMKQSRFDVVYLCETELTDDMKDYRCFGLVEGALQFSILMHLSGISIYAISLCTRDQCHLPSKQNIPRLQSRKTTTDHSTETEGGDVYDMVAIGAKRREENWATFDFKRGADIVEFAHAHGQKVWSWGESNNDEQFTYVQSRFMKVDAIISDNVPLWSLANVEAENPISSNALST